MPRNQRVISVSPPRLVPMNMFDLRGLDLYSPDELADVRRSPYAKNFRLFDNSSTEQRTAISKRNGHSFYTVPVGETVDQQLTSTTGASDKSIGLITRLAQEFTAGASGKLTKIELNLKNSTGTGPVIVEIYTDSSGPSELLATSSILNSSVLSTYSYLSARFIESPTVASGTSYWVVAYIQSDGANNYLWSSNTAATTAMTSIDGGTSWSAVSYALNLKTYVSTSGPVKGVQRYYRSTGSPETLFAHISDVYKVNDLTGAVTSIKGSLSASADFYDWSTVNNKCYWVNGVDAPQVYNGTTVAAVAGSPPATSDNIEIFANHLFFLQNGSNYCIFSNAADYEVFDSTNFIYIPSPNTADSVIKMLPSGSVLVFFTRNTKYLLHGTDLLSFVLQESPAKQGAVSPTAICRDGDFIYYMSNDHLIYRFNGATDDPINSQRVWPILNNIGSLNNVHLYVRDKKLHVSYRDSGQSVNNNKLVYDLIYDEWLSDEDVYTNFGIELNSQSDTNQHIVGSSIVGALYYGDTGTSDLGKPIELEWRTKYLSFGAPAAKHRIKRYYPFLTGQSGNYFVDCQVDKDNQNSPSTNLVSVNSALHFYGDSGLLYGSIADGGSGLTYGNTQLSFTRLSVPGSHRKTQLRFVQSGVDNPVGVEGMSLYVQPRRPA